ncbi:unnamed protein product [Calypogeia fissa]
MARLFCCCCCRSDASSPVRRDSTTVLSNTRKTYTLDELRRATKNFSSANVIGKGLFGTVYKGKLRNELGVPCMVAIKRYDTDFTKEFQVELNALSRLNHRNIVRCLGSCVLKNEKLIVLEYVHHGSLYNCLHYHKPLLTWTEKLTVALGIAEGLKYLRAANIIHRDPTSTNILIDKSLVPKIADFSLAVKAFRVKEEEGVNHIPFAGTKGYLDPEYRSQGTVSSAVDVYVFGVVLMELITGKPPVGPNDALLVTEMHQKQYDVSNFFDMADLAAVRSPPYSSSIKIATDLAIRCTNSDANQRPKLNEVLSTLEDALRLQARDLAGRRFDSDSSQVFLLETCSQSFEAMANRPSPF